MKAKLILILIITIISAGSYADQPADSSMRAILTKKDFNECDQYKYNANNLLPVYYSANQFDSMLLVIDFIDSVCCVNDDYKNIRLFIDYHDELIDENDSRFEDEVITYINNRRIRRYMLFGEVDKYYWSHLASIIGDCEISDYQAMLKDIGQTTIEISTAGSLAHLWGLIQTRKDSLFFNIIQDSLFDNSKVIKAYQTRIDSVHKAHKNYLGHFCVNIGSWLPLGSNKLLGNHGLVGGSVGLFTKGRILIDLTFEYRFLDSKEPYIMRNENDSLVETDKFNGFYGGLDISRTILGNKHFALDLLAGVGIDGFYGLSYDQGDDPDDHDYINSFCLNFGIRQKFYMDRCRTKYFGFQIKYNVVDYNTHGGTDLSGNTISITFIYGLLGRPGYQKALESIYYKGDVP